MVAAVRKSAPAFTATAVIEGLIKDISLSDYIGRWFGAIIFLRGKVYVDDLAHFRVVLFFYPMYVLQLLL